MASKKFSFVDQLTWAELQEKLRACEDEEEIRGMMNHEVMNRRRIPHVLRFHGKLNKLRALRERNQLMRGETL